MAALAPSETDSETRAATLGAGVARTTTSGVSASSLRLRAMATPFTASGRVLTAIVFRSEYLRR